MRFYQTQRERTHSVFYSVQSRLSFCLDNLISAKCRRLIARIMQINSVWWSFFCLKIKVVFRLEWRHDLKRCSRGTFWFRRWALQVHFSHKYILSYLFIAFLKLLRVLGEIGIIIFSHVAMLIHLEKFHYDLICSAAACSIFSRSSIFFAKASAAFLSFFIYILSEQFR